MKYSPIKKSLCETVLTSCDEDVDSGLPGVAGTAGVVPLVLRPGRHYAQLALRPVPQPGETHPSLPVVVDHLVVLVPEDVLGGLVVCPEGDDAGQHHRTAVVDVELVGDPGVVPNYNVALRPVDVQQHFLGQSSCRHGDLTFINTTVRDLDIFDLKISTFYYL